MKIKKAVIPVAGYGTRFLPFTKAMPKEMLPIVDKPILQYIVEEAVASGIEEIILITGQNKRAIEDHFDYSFELEMQLKKQKKMEQYKEIRRISDLARFVYIRQKEPLGLGHAILCAEKVIDNEPFAILYGDDLMDYQKPVLKQLIDVYNKYKGSVMAVAQVPHEVVNRYGIIKPKKIADRVYRVEDIVEKPDKEFAPSNLASHARVVMTPKIFSILKKTKPGKGGEIQITDAIETLIKTTPVYACEYEGKWYDGGNKLEYLKAVVSYGLKHQDLNGDFKDFLKTVVWKLTNHLSVNAYQLRIITNILIDWYSYIRNN